MVVDTVAHHTRVRVRWRHVEVVKDLERRTGRDSVTNNETVLHAFNNVDGANPYAGLTEGPDGEL